MSDQFSNPSIKKIPVSSSGLNFFIGFEVDPSNNSSSELKYQEATGFKASLNLGTAADLNVAASGNAGANEVVKGNDTRLIPITFTGEVTGTTVLTVQPTLISTKTLVTPEGDDTLLIADFSDSESFKKVKISDILTLVPSVTVDLGYVVSPTGGEITNTAGGNALLPLASGVNAGLMDPDDKNKLDNIEPNAKDDQTDSEIETAYNNQVPVVSQGDAEAGTSTTVYRWSPLRIAQAIAALAGGGGLQNNLTATTAPTVNDDASAGYSVGSFWIDTVADESYRCVDSSIGAAQWVKTSLQSSDLAAVAISGNSDDLIEGASKLLLTPAERSAIAANTLKITNATHTGEVTGDAALVIQSIFITNKATETAEDGDFIIFSDSSDSGNLKKADVTDFLKGSLIVVDDEAGRLATTVEDNKLLFQEDSDEFYKSGSTQGDISTVSTLAHTTPTGGQTVFFNNGFSMLYLDEATSPNLEIVTKNLSIAYDTDSSGAETGRQVASSIAGGPSLGSASIYHVTLSADETKLYITSDSAIHQYNFGIIGNVTSLSFASSITGNATFSSPRYQINLAGTYLLELDITGDDVFAIYSITGGDLSTSSLQSTRLASTFAGSSLAFDSFLFWENDNGDSILEYNGATNQDINKHELSTIADVNSSLTTTNNVYSNILGSSVGGIQWDYNQGILGFQQDFNAADTLFYQATNAPSWVLVDLGNSGGGGGQEESSFILDTSVSTSTTVSGNKAIVIVLSGTAASTINPFSSPSDLDEFTAIDGDLNSENNNILIDFTTAGQNLYGIVDNYIIDINGGSVTFKYINSTVGWVLK